MKALTNFDILDYYKKHNLNADVVMRDEIKKTLLDSKFSMPFISNLQGTMEPGSHWVGVYPTEEAIYYFDSFGVAPPQELIDVAKSHGRKIRYSDAPIQSLGSNQCGKYSAVFIKKMYKDPSVLGFYNFINSFPRQDFVVKGFDDDNERMIKDAYESDSSDEIIEEYSGGDLVNFLNRNIKTELHWFDVNKQGKIQRANFLGPNTNLDNRLKNYNHKTGTYDSVITEPISDLDAAALEHDIAYHSKDLKVRHQADKILEKKAIEIAKGSSNPIHKLNASLVYLIIKGKRKLGLGLGPNLSSIAPLPNDTERGLPVEYKYGGKINEQELIRQAQQLAQTREFQSGQSNASTIAQILIPLIALVGSIGIPSLIAAVKSFKKKNQK